MRRGKVSSIIKRPAGVILLLAAALPVLVCAQQVGPAAVVSTGGSASSSSGSLSWSLGQPSGATFQASELITAGVQQPDVVRLRLNIRAFLDGPYDPATGFMKDDLRALGSIPLLEPYSASGYPQAGDGGGEEISPTLLTTTGPDAIVDWVLVELRSSLNASQIVATRSALIQKDGDIVDTDGVSLLRFKIMPGIYKVAVRHRNHLGVLTAGSIALGGAPATVDLTIAGTAMSQGAAARKQINGAFPTLALWGGNANGNENISYYGVESDRQTILNTLGSSVPFSVLQPLYDPSDVNMDGMLNYYGVNSDRQFLLNNVGSSTPFNVLEVPLE